MGTDGPATTGESVGTDGTTANRESIGTDGTVSTGEGVGEDGGTDCTVTTKESVGTDGSSIVTRESVADVQINLEGHTSVETVPNPVIGEEAMAANDGEMDISLPKVDEPVIKVSAQMLSISSCSHIFYIIGQ